MRTPRSLDREATLTASAPLWVLLVEDDEETRRTLVDLLSNAGYVVVAVSLAEEGLTRLRSVKFAVVLSDYALPRETGSWMLMQAANDGLLEEVAAVMITGRQDAQLPARVRLVRKPASFEVICAEIATALSLVPRAHDAG